jgi:hypothetical protein
MPWSDENSPRCGALSAMVAKSAAAGKGGWWLMTESEHPPDTRIGALRNYTDRLAAMRTHLSVVTVLVAINLVMTAVLLWRLWNR